MFYSECKFEVESRETEEFLEQVLVDLFLKLCDRGDVTVKASLALEQL